MNIYIASDHSGFGHKAIIYEHLSKTRKLDTIIDTGCYTKESCDYPDLAHSTVDQIASTGGIGILVCGSGQGMSMSANKHNKIRAALVWNENIAKITREHNDANVICLGARYMDAELAIKCVDMFLNTSYSDEPRHTRRINKI